MEETAKQMHVLHQREVIALIFSPIPELYLRLLQEGWDQH